METMVCSGCCSYSGMGMYHWVYGSFVLLVVRRGMAHRTYFVMGWGGNPDPSFEMKKYFGHFILLAVCSLCMCVVLKSRPTNVMQGGAVAAAKLCLVECLAEYDEAVLAGREYQLHRVCKILFHKG